MKVVLENFNLMRIMAAVHHGDTLHIKIKDEKEISNVDPVMLKRFTLLTSKKLEEINQKEPSFFEEHNIIEIVERSPDNGNTVQG